MTPGPLAVGLLAGFVVVLAGGGAPPRAPTVRRQHDGSADQVALVRRLRAPLAGLALAAGVVVLGGAGGPVVGLAAAVLTWRVASRAESPAVRARAAVLERELPVAVLLMAAALRAGSAVEAALDDVAAAMPGPVAEELGALRHRVHLGSDPVRTWRSLSGPLAGLGRAMARAHRSGSSVAAAVETSAAEARAATRTRALAAARTVEVRTAAPLGLCFLPAFLLLGVVPMVAGIFSALDVLG